VSALFFDFIVEKGLKPVYPNRYLVQNSGNKQWISIHQKSGYNSLTGLFRSESHLILPGQHCLTFLTRLSGYQLPLNLPILTRLSLFEQCFGKNDNFLGRK
jgi:hypothetical protein